MQGASIAQVDPAHEAADYYKRMYRNRGRMHVCHTNLARCGRLRYDIGVRVKGGRSVGQCPACGRSVSRPMGQLGVRSGPSAC